MSATWPNKWTGRIAFVRGVSASSTAAGDKLNVAESMSANTGRAPQWMIASAVAANVNAVVTTSSPGPTPTARSASMSAAVPEATPTAAPAPISRAKARSKASTSWPRMKPL